MPCTFFENRFFFEKKTKTEAKFGPLSTTKYHWSRTDTHIDGDVNWQEWHEGTLCDQLYRASVPAKSLST